MQGKFGCRKARLKTELLGAGRARPAQQAGRLVRARRGQRRRRPHQGLIDERIAAKQARDFARADAIRQQLAGEGILLEDTAAGVRWKRA
jgi:cysteinyl-tRNA synthetase